MVPVPTLRRSRAQILTRAALTLLAGLLVWFGIIVFEEFVTADYRWGLWVGGAALFAVSLLLGQRGHGLWAPLVIAAPLVGLYGTVVVVDLPALWPHIPLWLGCALGGWLSTRRRGRVAIVTVGLLSGLMLGYGGWFIPRLLDEFTVYTNEPAPTFTLQTLEGDPYPMESLSGKVVVLDFFSTWCAPCIAELPEIEMVSRALSHREDIVFLVVGDGGGGDSLEQVAAFAEEIDIDLPFAYDPDSAAHDALGFGNVPALAVIDREGRVRLKRIGYNAAETGFRDKLTEFLETL